MMKRGFALALALVLLLACLPAQAEAGGARLSGSPKGSLARMAEGVQLIAASSSSDLRDKYGAYVAGNAFDGSLSTAWAESASDDGSRDGEWVCGDWRVASGSWQIEGVALWAGYHKSRDVYGKNCRPRDVEIEIQTDGDYQTFDVALVDAMSAQYVLFDAPIPMRDWGSARLILKSAYAGSKYRDTCLSEMDLLVSPAASASGNWFEDGAVSSTEVGETSLMRLFERLTGTVAYAGPGANDPDPNACDPVRGSIDGVDIGINAVYALPEDGFDARALLTGLSEVLEYEDPYGVRPVVSSIASVRLLESELYARSLENGVPRNTDEYYRFEVTTTGGETVQLLACTGYETDGGDWCDLVRIP